MTQPVPHVLTFSTQPRHLNIHRTPAFWLALMSSLQLGVEKGNVMKLIGRTAKKKRALNLGEAYVNRKNRQILKKTMKAGCGEKCRMRCQDRIAKDHMETVFHYFWRTGDFDKRRGYVCTNVEESSKKANDVPSRRQKSLKYHLEIAGLKQVIRKTMFSDILGISEQFLFTTFEKKDGGGRILPDRRGRHSEITPSFQCISTVL